MTAHKTKTLLADLASAVVYDPEGDSELEIAETIYCQFDSDGTHIDYDTANGKPIEEVETPLGFWSIDTARNSPYAQAFIFRPAQGGPSRSLVISEENGYLAETFSAENLTVTVKWVQVDGSLSDEKPTLTNQTQLIGDTIAGYVTTMKEMFPEW